MSGRKDPASFRILTAAIAEKQELRDEFIVKGLPVAGVNTEILRLIARLTALDEKERNE